MLAPVAVEVGSNRACGDSRWQPSRADRRTLVSREKRNGAKDETRSRKRGPGNLIVESGALVYIDAENRVFPRCMSPLLTRFDDANTHESFVITLAGQELKAQVDMAQLMVAGPAEQHMNFLIDRLVPPQI